MRSLAAHHQPRRGLGRSRHRRGGRGDGRRRARVRLHPRAHRRQERAWSPPTRCSSRRGRTSSSSPRSSAASTSRSKRRSAAASPSSGCCAKRSPATRSESLYGIVNGTSNYILTRMREDGLRFGEALGEAQAKGYAEADPTLDIDGSRRRAQDVGAGDAGVRRESRPRQDPDRGHPLHRAHRPSVRRPLRASSSSTWRSAAIRAIASSSRVHPTLVHKRSVLANVSGVLNAMLPRGARARALPHLRARRGRYADRGERRGRHRRRRAVATGRRRRPLDARHLARGAAARCRSARSRRATTCASPGKIARACWRASPARSASTASASSRWCKTVDRSRPPSRSPIVMITHRARECGRASRPSKPIGAADYVTEQTRRAAHRRGLTVAAPAPLRRATRRSACSTRGSAGSRWCARCASGCPPKSIVYLGDTARVPYGTRSQRHGHQVRARLLEGAHRARREGHRRRLQHGERGGARHACASSSICRCSA